MVQPPFHKGKNWRGILAERYPWKNSQKSLLSLRNGNELEWKQLVPQLDRNYDRYQCISHCSSGSTAGGDVPCRLRRLGDASGDAG